MPLQVGYLHGPESGQLWQELPPEPQALVEVPPRQLSPEQQPLHWLPWMQVHLFAASSQSCPPVHGGELPQRHALFTQLSVVADGQMLLQALQLSLSLVRLRQAICSGQQVGVAPVHWSEPSLVALQSLSLLSQFSVCVGKTEMSPSRQSSQPLSGEASPVEGQPLHFM